MYSTQEQTNYVISMNETLQQETKDLRSQLAEKTAELDTMETDNDRMDERLRYQRGMLSNLNAIVNESAKVATCYKGLVDAKPGRCNAKTAGKMWLIHLSFTLVAAYLWWGWSLSYGSAIGFEAAALVTTSSLLIRFNREEQRQQARYVVMTQRLAIAIKELDKLKKSTDYVQELIDSV